LRSGELGEGSAIVAQAEVLNWIDGAEPQQMHCVVVRWYWDYGWEIPRKIIDQPRCNVSTAVEVFFAIVAGGMDSPEDRHLDPDCYQMLITVSDRLRESFYAEPPFAVGPLTMDFIEDKFGAHRTIDRYGPGSFWDLPRSALEMPIGGLEIDCSAYFEGNPPDLEW
jgi:hypothetical protein